MLRENAADHQEKWYPPLYPFFLKKQGYIMGVYEDRRLKSLEVAKEILDRDDLRASKSCWVTILCRFEADYRIADHVDYICTKTGEQIGVFTQPYTLPPEVGAEIAKLKGLGVEVFTVNADNWWNPTSDQCTVYFICKRKKAAKHNLYDNDLLSLVEV